MGNVGIVSCEESGFSLTAFSINDGTVIHVFQGVQKLKEKKEME